MTLSPLHLEHLKRCLNRLSIAVLHADQPGVSRLAEQPPVMQQALRRLQQGLDATAGVVAVQQWSGQATPEPMPAPEEGVMGHPTLVPEPPIAPAAQAERSAASGSMQAETAASIADGAVDRDATSSPAAPAAPAAPPAPTPADTEAAYEEFPVESVDVPVAVVEVESPAVAADPTPSPAAPQPHGPERAMAQGIATAIGHTQRAWSFFRAIPWHGGESLSPESAGAAIPAPEFTPEQADYPPARMFFQAMPWVGRPAATAPREDFSIRPGSEVLHLPLPREMPAGNPVLAATTAALRTAGQADSGRGGAASGFFKHLPWSGPARSVAVS